MLSQLGRVYGPGFTGSGLTLEQKTEKATDESQLNTPVNKNAEPSSGQQDRVTLTLGASASSGSDNRVELYKDTGEQSQNTNTGNPIQASSQSVSGDITQALISSIKQRLTLLHQRAEQLLQEIPMASEQQLPNVSKRLKQVVQELKQLVGQYKALSSTSGPAPSATAMSAPITGSISADPSINTSMNTSTSSGANNLANQSLSISQVSAEAAVAQEATASISIFNNQLQAEDLAVDANDTQAFLDQKNLRQDLDQAASQSSSEVGNSEDSEEKGDGVLTSVKELLEKLKQARDLLKERAVFMSNRDDQNLVEKELQDIDTLITELDSGLSISMVVPISLSAPPSISA